MTGTAPVVYEVDILAEILIEPGPSETLAAEDTSCASQHARPRGKAAPSKFSIVICALF